MQNPQSTDQQIQTVIVPQNDYQKSYPIYIQGVPMLEQQMPDRQINPHLMATSVHGRNPQMFYCVYCQKNQLSQVYYELGSGSWIWVGLSLIFCPCIACLPCFIKECKDAVHDCPGCGREVGRKKFLIE